MFFRKIVYMGECGEGAVYFDTEQNLALLAPPSRLLNTACAGKTNLLLPALVALGFGGTGLVVANPFGGYYSYATLVYLILLWLAECFGLIWLLERALYKNVKQAQPTTRQHFRTAVYGNLFWNNFGDKRATVGKKLAMFLVVFSIVLTNLAFIPAMIYSIIPNILNQVAIDSRIIILSIWGIMPAILVILVWQNNPIRWFNIVGRYQRREIPWGKSVH
ncbi:hypothetical protein [Streptococcus acidominimus]|uniref:Uncharacterized protein n=1 Tax=Streptococcus acidominimus TaxID=1326 RepID=A0A4Y9FNG3_STRAI|nr:hypothetical protein [Streptococcus acidominimus]MBF0818794.1 hypothetical protein [Streptococcus acidominimus]MBF0839209.1 hypothetical protein [Streptococcus acidominimus]MBF0849150.1 hypothetical protein [Streptococcus danieliae]TFU30744.1 hypothetical protein E4U01_04910 [Streptococcus acidominimus]